MERALKFAITPLLLSLMSCASSPHGANEKYFFLTTNVKLPYWQQAQAGVSRAAAQLGLTATMVGTDTYDPKGEQDLLREVINKKPSGILISVSNPTLLKGDIDSAIAQGIPVVTMDSDAPESKRLMFIGTDNYKAGVMGAKVVVDKLGGKGNVVVYTMPAQANLRERMRGYTDIFAEHPQIKIVEVVDLKGDPRVVFDKTMDLLEKGAKVDAFVCLEAVAGPEVAEVLGRKKAEKVVVAMDADPRTLEAIQKGQITASIGQKPFTMAFLGIKALDDLHHHPLKSLSANFTQDSFSPVATSVDTGVTLIDKSNVDAFIQAQNSETSAK